MDGLVLLRLRGGRMRQRIRLVAAPPSRPPPVPYLFNPSIWPFPYLSFLPAICALPFFSSWFIYLVPLAAYAPVKTLYGPVWKLHNLFKLVDGRVSSIKVARRTDEAEDSLGRRAAKEVSGARFTNSFLILVSGEVERDLAPSQFSLESYSRGEVLWLPNYTP